MQVSGLQICNAVCPGSLLGNNTEDANVIWTSPANLIYGTRGTRPFNIKCQQPIGALLAEGVSMGY
jgi:hypothetical protein